MEALIRRIPVPRNLQVKNIEVSDVTVAMDDSGSTQTDGIIEAELKHVGQALGAVSKKSKSYQHHQSGSQPLILWSSRALLVQPNSPFDLQFGGTHPQYILHDAACNRLVQDRSVFVLCTDGEIDTGSVQQMSTQSTEILQNKALNVGIIVYPRSDTVARVNISVLAPLFVGPYVVLVLRRDNLFYLVSTNSEDVLQSVRGRALPDVSQPWESFPAIADLRAFMTSIKVKERPRISSDLLRVRTLPDEIHVIEWPSLEDILSRPEALAEIQTWDWKSIMQHVRLSPEKQARLRNGLIKFRDMILPKIVHPTVSEESKQRSLQIDELAKLLAEHKCTTPTQEEEVRTMYLSLRQQAMSSDYQSRKQILLEQRERRAFIEGLLADITDMQKAGWSLEDMSKGYGNRALRADMIDALLIESKLRELRDDPTLETAWHPIECQICMDTGDAALMLIPGEDAKDDFYLSDFCIDCPLACGFQASKKFSNLHVCMRCAEFYMARGEDVYHRPLLGVWPVLRPSQDPKIPYPKAAMEYYRLLAQHAFLGDKDMAHGLQLMLAAVENTSQYEWGKTGEWPSLRDTLIQGLTRSIKIPDMFTSGEAKVPFITAMTNLLNKPEVWVLKPASLQYVLLRLNTVLNIVDNDRVHDLELSALASSLVSSLRKLSNERLEEVYQQILLWTHDHPINIPVRGTFHLADFTNQNVPELNQLMALHASMPSSRVTTQEWTNMLLSIIRLRHLFKTAKAEELLRRMGERDAELFQYLYPGTVSARPAQPVRSTPLLPEFYKSDPRHSDDSFFVPYALNMGPFSCPDPLTCSCCGYQFAKLNHPYGIRAYKLADIIQQAWSARRQHFEEVYGSEVPSNKSFHCQLHSTVASVMSASTSTDEKEILQQVSDRLRATNGQKGDIFKPSLLEQIQHTIQDFKRLRSSSRDWSVEYADRPLIARSFAYKVFCALKLRGLIPDDEIFPEEMVERR